MTGPRKRFEDFYGPKEGRYWSGGAGQIWPTNPGVAVPLWNTGVQDLQVTRGNAYQLLGSSNRRIGGDFAVVRHEWHGSEIPSRPYNHTTNLNLVGNRYVGPIVENVGYNSTNYPSQHASSASELKALGTNIIAGILPTNPLSGLVVALGELKREGLPDLYGVQSWRDRAAVARNAGSEYLNHQFGWIPLVNDLKRFNHSVTNSDELVAAYAANSGKRIKRHVTLPIDEVVSVTTGSRAIAPDLPFIYKDTSSHKEYNFTDLRSKERWLAACFTYYLPPFNPNGENVSRNEQLTNYLYGTRPTPEALWNLAPWSWAADWVGNFGNVIHNVSQFQQDGLVMQYAYIMEKGIHSVTYVHPKVEFKSYPGVVHGVSATVTTTVKQRYVATPYGFGLNVGSFTPRQWSILVALGLARGNNTIID